MRINHIVWSVLSAALMLATFASCQKEAEGIPTTIHIVADKTHIQAGQVLWDAGDQIAVIRGMSQPGNIFQPFNIGPECVGTSNGVFSGSVTGTEGNYHVVYPYDPDNLPTIDANGLHLVAVKPEQTLVHGTFGRGDNVAVGLSENTSVYLQNLGGLMKVCVHGNFNLTEIRLTDNGGQPLAGPATVPLYGLNRLSIHFDDDATSTIVARPAGGSIAIHGCDTFYIVVPPITLTNYTITLVRDDGWENSLVFNQEVYTVSRSQVKTKDVTPSVFHPVNELLYRTNDGDDLDECIANVARANNTSVEAIQSLSDGWWQASFADTISTIPESSGTGFGNLTNLTDIIIPNNVVGLGPYAFQNCTNLTSVVLSENLTEIPTSAFEETGLRSIVIPEGVTRIGQCAFMNCRSLTTVTLPNTLTDVSSTIFYGDIYLSEINIPTGLTQISDLMFYNCTLLTSINLHEGITRIGHDAFGYCQSLASLVIPESVTSIGREAFRNCSGLTSVVIKGCPNILAECFMGHVCQEWTILSRTPPRLVPIYRNNNYNIPYMDQFRTSISRPINLHVPSGCAQAYRDAEYEAGCRYTTWFTNIVDDATPSK
ncbi:MAG: leucine-rich repeat domain-containing protein [Bacteroidales bacterium]|nr:leucine-rich repeat domain-containing protein [Bacteroidales bacterium]